MKGTKKHKTVGRSKPSHLSLVSRGLAVNSALTRYKEGEDSGPPSVRSGYSLYSSDSESTAKEVNQGLNRCAKLLTNILDSSDQQAHPLKAGHATYRHQGQKSKTSSKPCKSHSSKQEPRLPKSHQKNPAQGKPTKTSQAKTYRPKNPKTKDAVAATTSNLLVGKKKGHEVPESSSQRSATVHVIPTGSDSSADRPAARPSTAHQAQSSSKNVTRVTAPGFQDCLMSSTPAERESPQKPEHTAAAPNERAKSYDHQRHRKELQQSTLAQQQLGMDKRTVFLPSKDSNPNSLRKKSPAQFIENSHHQRDSKAPDTETENEREGPVEYKQRVEPDTDWMKWYEESVAKQTMYEGLARGDSNPSLLEQNNGRQGRSLPSESETRASNPGFTSSTFPKQRAQHPNQGSDMISQQPLQDSQDLLRDLVQQLTILNKSNKTPIPLGNTQDLLQGLINRGHHVQTNTLGNNTGEKINQLIRADTGSHQLPYTDQERVPHEGLQTGKGQPSLTQLLSEFRQIPPQLSPGIRGEVKTSAFPLVALPPEAGTNLDRRYLSSSTEELLPSKDIRSSSPQAELGVSSPRVTFLTPKKDFLPDDSDGLSQVSTPYIHQAGREVPRTTPGKYVQVGNPTADVNTSPPRSTEPLIMDPRGQAIKQRSMQQIRALKYLIGELQAVLGDHEDVEVSRLLNELEEVCNTLPYTTQKQLLDLNTEVLLALQPLQSENGQLRRRLRIVNHQLKSREMAEKEQKDAASVSLEAMTLQALNSNLQKQLREERKEKEQLMRSNLEMSQTLEEKEQQHQNMLRILDDKDTNLLKSRQDCLKELQDLRGARRELQSQIDYLELQVEAANKETRILQLSLEQRDNEIARIKSFNESLQERVKTCMSQQKDGSTSPRTLGGISLQRMSKLLMERSPNKTYKENIPEASHRSNSVTPPSKKHLQPTKKQYEVPKSHLRSDRWFEKSLKRSPNRQVKFSESPRDQDVSEWARTNTLWKDHQALPGGLISFETGEDHREANPVSTSGEERTGRLATNSSPLQGLRDIYEVTVSPDPLIRGNFSPMQESSERPKDDALLRLPHNTNTLPHREDAHPAGTRFSDKRSFENGISDFQSVPATSAPGFGRDFDDSPSEQQPLQGRKYRSLLDIPCKLEAASVISDSTVSSVTTQYEAQFQSGLRDLDAEIGKLQASLKYSAFKS